jgi:tRNA pseudouridine38-40 synthase
MFKGKDELTCRTCDSRVYEYLLPTYCLLPPASDDALAKHLDASSPGWREGLGEAAAFADAWVPEEEESKAEGADTEVKEGASEIKEGEETKGGEETKEGEGAKEGEGIKVAPKKAGEFERRRGWRCDQFTLERFRALIKQFVGTQYVPPLTNSACLSNLVAD